MAQAVSVAGPTATLGSDILLHEHLLYDHTARALPPITAEDISIRDEGISLGRLAVLRQNARAALVNLRAPPSDVLVRELTALRAGRPSGSCTVVDASISGRDLAGLLVLSEASGVNIVASAGVTADEAQACADDVDALADRLVEELTRGVDVASREQPIRCGMLVVDDAIAPGSPPLARVATLGAVGQAQKRTGAPLLLALPVALGDATLAVDVCTELVHVHGANASAIIIGHSQRLLETGALGVLERLVGLGVTLCFDGLGCEWMVAGAGSAATLGRFEMPLGDAALAQQLRSLFERLGVGIAERVVLSNGVATRLQLEAFGGGGLRHVRRAFLPRLFHLGLAEEAAEKMTSSNAASLLAWWRPAGPAPRVCKHWECTGCHRVFEEAVNPAEALPEDQIYFEKHTFRYCSTHCLSSHRQAGFPAAGFVCKPPPAK